MSRRGIVYVSTFFLFLTFLYSITEPAFNDWRRAAREARRHFVSELHLSSYGLVNRYYALTEDEVLMGHLDQGLMNSFQQGLVSYLRNGELTRVDWLDSSCNLLSSASLQGLGSSLCPLFDEDAASLIWTRDHHNKPLMVLGQHFRRHGKQFTVLLYLALDNNWLRTRQFEMWPPGLQIKVSIPSTPDEIPSRFLWSAGDTLTGEPLVVLNINGWLVRLLPPLQNFSLQPLSSSIPHLLGFLLLLAGILWNNYIREQVRLRGIFAEFLAWGRDLTAQRVSPTVQAEMLPNGVEKAAPQRLISFLKNVVTELLEERNARVKKQEKRLKLLEEQLRERDGRTSELEHKLQELASLYAISDQLTHSSEAFLQRLKSLQSDAATMLSASVGGLTKEAKSLGTFCERWNAGINEVFAHREHGARRYLRHLAETPGRLSGTTRLDEDLAELEGMAQHFALRTGGLEKEMQAVLGHLEYCTKVAGLWRGISYWQNERGNLDMSLADVVAAVEASLRFHSQMSEVRLRYDGDKNHQDLPQNLPIMTLHVALYHLVFAIAPPPQNNAPCQITVRHRMSSSTGTLVLALPNAPGTKGSPRSHFHFELAESVLLAQGLQAKFLPPSDTLVGVAFSWPLDEAAKTPAESEVLPETIATVEKPA